MFYEMSRGRVGYITYEELQDDYVMYGFPNETVEACKGNPHNFRSDSYVYADLIFTVLDVLDFQNVFEVHNRFGLYVKQDLCLFVGIQDEDGKVRKNYEDIVNKYENEKNSAKYAMPERFLCLFFEYLIREDKRFLENMEFHMSTLETRILKERVDASFINEILLMKKELMYIWNYYEQLIDVCEVFRDNDSELFPEENIKSFDILTERISRLNENVKYLKEYTVQLRETHDAMLDYNLNNIMKVFTVITTIFLPLTLLVGWYGMNFEYMPELHWRYGYVAMIVVSITTVIGVILAFRRYRLL